MSNSKPIPFVVPVTKAEAIAYRRINPFRDRETDRLNEHKEKQKDKIEKIMQQLSLVKL